MAYEIPLFTITGVCGATSLATKQYYFVKYHTDGTIVVCSALTDVPIGVLQNNPGIGGECTIMSAGITKVSADAALAINDLIGPSADGQADPRVIGTDTTHYVVGRIIEAAANAGELATAMINCMAPHRAA